MTDEETAKADEIEAVVSQGLQDGHGRFRHEAASTVGLHVRVLREVARRLGRRAPALRVSLQGMTLDVEEA